MIWKKIPGYENYRIREDGLVKNTKTKKRYLGIKNPKTKYLQFSFKGRTIKIHQLVAMAFLDHVPCGMKLVVDHFPDRNIYNNHYTNLRIVTQRENSLNTSNKTSKYPGVSWSKKRNKWVAQIQINGKKMGLGRFNNELQAADAYNNKLNQYANS